MLFGSKAKKIWELTSPVGKLRRELSRRWSRWWHAACSIYSIRAETWPLRSYKLRKHATMTVNETGKFSWCSACQQAACYSGHSTWRMLLSQTPHPLFNVLDRIVDERWKAWTRFLLVIVGHCGVFTTFWAKVMSAKRAVNCFSDTMLVGKLPVSIQQVTLGACSYCWTP